jgi:hypothetical protein
MTYLGQTRDACGDYISTNTHRKAHQQHKTHTNFRLFPVKILPLKNNFPFARQSRQAWENVDQQCSVSVCMLLFGESEKKRIRSKESSVKNRNFTLLFIIVLWESASACRGRAPSRFSFGIKQSYMMRVLAKRARLKSDAN